MTAQACALLYAALAAMPVTMHIALAAGAPLGRLTVGGRFPGRLPPLWRVLALVQAALLVAMALVVLGRASLVSDLAPDGLFWPVVAGTALTCGANAATTSRLERLLWLPVTLVMLSASLGTAFL